MSHPTTTNRDTLRPKASREIDAHLRRNGIRDAYLLKGQGICSFEGEATNDWIDHIVRVSFLGDLTLDQWLQTYQAMDSNPANRLSTCQSNRNQ